MNNPDREDFQPTSISDTYSTDTGLGQEQTLDRYSMINNFVNKSEMQNFKENVQDKINYFKQRIEDIKNSFLEKDGETKSRIESVEGQFKTFSDRFWMILSILTAILFALFLWLIPYLYNKENTDNIISIKNAIEVIDKKISNNTARLDEHDQVFENMRKLIKNK